MEVEKSATETAFELVGFGAVELGFVEEAEGEPLWEPPCEPPDDPLG